MRKSVRWSSLLLLIFSLCVVTCRLFTNDVPELIIPVKEIENEISDVENNTADPGQISEAENTEIDTENTEDETKEDKVDSEVESSDDKGESDSVADIDEEKETEEKPEAEAPADENNNEENQSEAAADVEKEHWDEASDSNENSTGETVDGNENSTEEAIDGNENSTEDSVDSNENSVDEYVDGNENSVEEPADGENDVGEDGAEAEKTETDLIPEETDDENQNIADEALEPEIIPETKRLWTIFMYMCGDNNLEAEALCDIREMESSLINTDEITVLVLLDRSSSFDTSDGNWKGSRMYELKTGPSQLPGMLVSKEIECKSLSLEPGTEIHLNMSSPYVLSSFLEYGASEYEAENYGLVMWGHGNGWRNETEESEEVNSSSITKGFVFDESTGDYMTVSDLRRGLKDFNQKHQLSFIGFDTCFSSEIEVLYELKDCGKFAVASEGLVDGAGWNYEALFNAFSSSELKTADEFTSLMVRQYKEEYRRKSGASICRVNLPQMDSYFRAFESFMRCAADSISSGGIRNSLIKTIFGQVEMYSNGITGCDVYADIYSLIDRIEYVCGGKNTPLETRKNEFIEVMNSTVPESWSFYLSSGGIGVFFGCLTDSGLFATSHPKSYLKRRNGNQLLFIEDSVWYVPYEVSGDSFIDKLFYRIY